MSAGFRLTTGAPLEHTRALHPAGVARIEANLSPFYVGLLDEIAAPGGSDLVASFGAESAEEQEAGFEAVVWFVAIAVVGIPSAVDDIVNGHFLRLLRRRPHASFARADKIISIMSCAWFVVSLYVCFPIAIEFGGVAVGS